MFLRSTLAQSMPFEDLIVRLNTTKLISPEYLIVAGVNSGTRLGYGVDLPVLTAVFGHWGSPPLLDCFDGLEGAEEGRGGMRPQESRHCMRFIPM